jgi:hypothetical protein
MAGDAVEPGQGIFRVTLRSAGAMALDSGLSTYQSHVNDRPNGQDEAVNDYESSKYILLRECFGLQDLICKSTDGRQLPASVVVGHQFGLPPPYLSSMCSKMSLSTAKIQVAWVRAAVL